MKDSEILESASKLMRKYFHPSRLRMVPSPEMATDMNQAESLLKWAAIIARKDEEGDD